MNSTAKKKDTSVFSENNILISKEQRRQLNEAHKIQESLGLKREKGANYTLNHPCDRSIQIKPTEKKTHKNPFHFNQFE